MPPEWLSVDALEQALQRENDQPDRFNTQLPAEWLELSELLLEAYGFAIESMHNANKYLVAQMIFPQIHLLPKSPCCWLQSAKYGEASHGTVCVIISMPITYR